LIVAGPPTVSGAVSLADVKLAGVPTRAPGRAVVRDVAHVAALAGPGELRVVDSRRRAHRLLVAALGRVTRPAAPGWKY
jgi:hypothetical protein